MALKKHEIVIETAENLEINGVGVAERFTPISLTPGMGVRLESASELLGDGEPKVWTLRGSGIYTTLQALKEISLRSSEFINAQPYQTFDGTKQAATLGTGEIVQLRSCFGTEKRESGVFVISSQIQGDFKTGQSATVSFFPVSQLYTLVGRGDQMNFFEVTG